MLGEKVKDQVTGFTGTVTAKCEYLNGETKYEVTPSIIKPGELPKTEWFQSGRLTIQDSADSYIGASFKTTSASEATNSKAAEPLLNYTNGSETLFEGLNISKTRAEEIIEQMTAAFNNNKGYVQNSENLYSALTALLVRPRKHFSLVVWGAATLV